MKDARSQKTVLFDHYLLATVIIIMAIGLLMVASASMVIAERQSGEPFHYLIRQAIYMLIGVILALISFLI